MRRRIFSKSQKTRNSPISYRCCFSRLVNPPKSRRVELVRFFICSVAQVLEEYVYMGNLDVSLPLKAGSLAELFGMISKEVRIDGSDDEGEVLAGVQNRGGTLGKNRPEHIGHGEDFGAVVANAAQLDQGGAAAAACRSWSEVCESGANGDCATACGAGASEDGAQHSGKSDGVLREAAGLQYAWIERHRGPTSPLTRAGCI